MTDDEETVEVSEWVARAALRELDNLIQRTGGESPGQANEPIAEVRKRLHDGLDRQSAETVEVDEVHNAVERAVQGVGVARDIEFDPLVDPLTDEVFQARNRLRVVLEESDARRAEP